MKYKRLKELCHQVWPLLTKEEQEAYIYGTGTIGFVEDIARIVNIEVEDILAEALDEILDLL
jgi:soluble P-type ATPase